MLDFRIPFHICFFFMICFFLSIGFIVVILLISFLFVQLNSNGSINQSINHNQFSQREGGWALLFLATIFWSCYNLFCSTPSSITTKFIFLFYCFFFIFLLSCLDLFLLFRFHLCIMLFLSLLRIFCHLRLLFLYLYRIIP